MANQPYEVNPSDHEKKAREKQASTNPPTIAHLPAVSGPSASFARPTKSVHQCLNCGAWAPAGSSVCTECGARLQQKPQKIRCRLCGVTASASLVICPHCGRELQAAPSRVLSWGAPTVLVCLFLIVMIQRWGNGNPVRWVQTQVTIGRSWVNQLAEQLDPQITVSILPEAVTESNTVGVPLAPPSDVQENALVFNANNDSSPGQVAAFGQENPATLANTALVNTPAVETLAANQPTGALIQSATVTPTATIEQPTATASPGPEPTITATTPPPTPPPTATAPATPTTAAATPTTTPRQPTTEAIVQTLQKAGTPAGGIGGAVTAANASPAPTETPTVTILQPTATLEPTPTAVPTQAATSTPAPRTYTVRAGDTPLGIANEFDISVNELLAINGMSIDDARRLRVGQVLVIPGGDTLATPTQLPPSPTTATTTRQATATAAPAATNSTANTTAAAAAPQSAIRVDAPTLRSPEVGSSLSCGSTNSLVWLPVAFIRENDQYLLHLGFLSGYNGDSSEQVTWILEQWRPANVTLWDLDEGLCGLAPQAFGRQWRWYVEVVEAANDGWRPVSPPSQIWGFSWN